MSQTEREFLELEKLNIFARETIRQKLGSLAESLGVKLRQYCGTNTMRDLLKLHIVSFQECLYKDVLATEIDYLIWSAEGCCKNIHRKDLEDGITTELSKKVLYHADYLNPISIISGGAFDITITFRLA